MSVYDDMLAADSGSAKPAANPYLDALQADDDARQRAMAGTLTTATKVNPEQYSASRRIAGYLGYPTAAVEAMPSLIDQAKVQQIKQDTAGAPVLQQRYTDADFAKLAHDDSNSLTAIESAIRALGGAAKFVTSAPEAPWGGLIGAGRAIASGVPSASAGLYGAAASAFGLADQAIQGIDNAAAFVTGTKRRQIVGTPGPEGFMRSLAASSSADATAVLGLSADAGFWERGVKSGLQSAGQNLAMLPVGLAETGAISGEAAVLSLMGLITGGQSYTKGRDAGLNPLAATAFAAQDATAEVVTEKYLGMAGFLKNVKAGASAGKLAMFELSKEVPGEIAATLWQNFNEWANLNPSKSVGEFISEQPEAVAQTILATLVGGGVQIGAVRGMQRLAGDSARRQAQAQEAEQFAQQAEALGKLAEASKLRGRDAETFKQFVAQVADQEGEAPTEFFIDGQMLQNSLNQSGVSREELAAIAPVVAAQLENPQTGDLRVPVAEFIAAGEAVTAPLVDHLRATPDAMTRAEAQDFLKVAGEGIKADVEAALQQHDQSAAFRESIAGVQAQFQAQLDAAQRFPTDVNKAYATLLANYFGAQAQRLGVTPEEFAQRYGLQVQAHGAAGARTMEQADPATPQFKAWFGDSKVVDAKGKPLVVYHGTGKDFSSFDRKAQSSHIPLPGFFFTPDHGIASMFAESAAKLSEHRAGRPFQPVGANVMPTYLSIKNPASLVYRDRDTATLTSEKRVRADLEAAEKAGHDGAIIEGWADGSGPVQYVAFRPEQIKSAIGNSGAFNPNDPSILNQSATPARDTIELRKRLSVLNKLLECMS
jgi:hypothetical protein